MLLNVKSQMLNVKSQMLNVQRGSILLEAFIAVMIISIAFSILLDTGTLSVKNSTSIQKNTQANFLLKEAMEAVRSFRDSTTWSTNGLGSSAVTAGIPYYFSVVSNAWTLNEGMETAGIFTRKIIFDKVSRDPATSNIETTYNASNDDPNTRKVTATVIRPEKTVDLITYFTNWKQ